MPREHPFMPPRSSEIRQYQREHIIYSLICSHVRPSKVKSSQHPVAPRSLCTGGLGSAKTSRFSSPTVHYDLWGAEMKQQLTRMMGGLLLLTLSACGQQSQEQKDLAAN